MSEQELLKIMISACERELTPETELCESEILDSLGLILLGEALEERGISVSVARIPREALRDVRTLWQWLAAEGKTASPEK